MRVDLMRVELMSWDQCNQVLHSFPQKSVLTYMYM